MYKNVVLFKKKSYFYKKKDMKTTIKSPTKRTLNKSDDFQLTLPVLNQKTKMAELDFLGSISKR